MRLSLSYEGDIYICICPEGLSCCAVRDSHWRWNSLTSESLAIVTAAYANSIWEPADPDNALLWSPHDTVSASVFAV